MKYFSIIELLIVMAIFAILANLLMPTMNSISAKSDQVKTSRNFSQTYQTFQLFAEDHSDWILSNRTVWSSEQGYQMVNYQGRTVTIRWPIDSFRVLSLEGYLSKKSLLVIVFIS